ncbi:MAG: AzlD domain-containing protein [Synechococcales bacterium]|nr:AzlD domain-containing protein [Synechococcales bacterium]
MDEVLMITGMAIATFAIRYTMFAASSRITLSATLLKALRYVPPVVLTAIVVPEVLLNDGALHLSLLNARLVGAIAAVAVGALTQNLLLTIVLGLAAFFGWQGVLNFLT